MKIRFGGLIAIAFVIVTTFLQIPASAMAQSAASKDIPRLPNGKPDFSGVWDHPRVLDVTRDGKGCGGGTPGCTQKGNGELSFTPEGARKFKGPRIESGGIPTVDHA